MTIETPTPRKSVFRLLLILIPYFLIVGLIAGGIAGFISQWFYLPILFPLGEAFIIVTGAGRFRRNDAIAGFQRPQAILSIAVLFAAFVAYGTYHYIGYAKLRGEIASALHEVAANKNTDLTPEQITRGVDLLIVRLTNQSGFLGGLILQADSGITLNGFIGRGGYVLTQQSIALQGAGVWLYWTVELAIIAGASYSSTRRTVTIKAQIKCAACGSRRVRESIGAVQPPSSILFLAATDSGNFDQAGELIVSYDLGSLRYPRMDVEVEHCEKCNDDASILRIFRENSTTKNEKLREQPISPREFQELRAAIPTELSAEAAQYLQHTK